MMLYTCGASPTENGGHIFVSLCFNLFCTIWWSEQFQYIQTFPSNGKNPILVQDYCHRSNNSVVYLACNIH